MNCLHPLGGADVCAHCGFASNFAQESPLLPLRSLLLQGRYIVGRALDHSGDGITYTGWDNAQGKPVRLREFFPDALASRESDRLGVQAFPCFEQGFGTCRDAFRALWHKLEQMRGLSGLVPVLGVFEENNTVYAVQEAVEGSTLREYLLLRSVTGTLPAEGAQKLLAPLLPTLSALHGAGVLHLGISPSTVLVTPERKLCLTGFTIWQARTAGGGLRSELYPGYAASEQYGLSERQGPWTDVYAAAGLYYRVLVGSDPIDASLRIRNDRLMIPGKLAEQVPAYVINALTNALEIKVSERTENVEKFRAELNAAPDAVWANVQPQPLAPVLPAQDASPVPPQKTSGKIVLATVATTLGVCLLVGIVLALTVFRDVVSGWWPRSVTLPPQVPVTTDLQTGDFIVPDFMEASRGRTYTDILDTLPWKQQFKLETEFDWSATVATNEISAQSIPAGQRVPLGTVIKLTVSKGPELVRVPPYIDYLLGDVRGILEGAGLVIEVINEPNDGTHQEGQIIQGSIEEGSECERGKKLYLHVYAAPPTQPPETDPETEETPDIYAPQPEPTTARNLIPWWPF
ncbi:MAG: PASTA domain-containing protein [Oscillospiraceae bacterium]|jgi:serine/threonine-protein kinase|nr:PASTA domain-containing protein [Oscillospiraceae bacterium]